MKDFIEKHEVKNIDWDEIDHGTRLMKFVSKSPESHPGDIPCYPTIEIHGFITEYGEFYITDEKVEYPKEQK